MEDVSFRYKRVGIIMSDFTLIQYVSKLFTTVAL